MQCTATATAAQSRTPALTNACSTLSQHAARLQTVRAHTNASIYITHTTPTRASAAGASSPCHSAPPACSACFTSNRQCTKRSARYLLACRKNQHPCFPGHALQLRLSLSAAMRPTACCPMCTAHTSVSLKLMLHAAPQILYRQEQQPHPQQTLHGCAATALPTAQLLPPRPPALTPGSSRRATSCCARWSPPPLLCRCLAA